MKIALLFPGQGAQYVGMGKDLFENYSEVKQLYNIAEGILQFPLKKICFEGPEEELKKTKFTQPAIFVHSIAVSRLIAKKIEKPTAVAGHSLGEYSALVAAEAFSFEEALKLVKLRAELMQYAGEIHPGTMAAIIGLSEETVIQICKDSSQHGIVQPANFNSPGQIVISGSIEGVRRAMELAKEKNARMVTELVVSGAFHSPLMKEALEGLTEALEKAEIIDPNTPVYTNVTGDVVYTAGEIRNLLKMQLLSPVLWQNIIEKMIKNGIKTFYEVGPSKILSGLNKRINRDVTSVTLGTVQELASL